MKATIECFKNFYTITTGSGRNRTVSYHTYNEYKPLHFVKKVSFFERIFFAFRRSGKVNQAVMKIRKPESLGVRQVELLEL